MSEEEILKMLNPEEQMKNLKEGIEVENILKNKLTKEEHKRVENFFAKLSGNFLLLGKGLGEMENDAKDNGEVKK